jgi:2-dehydro-3-deoxyphosphogluconate aldolase/(4S)-4-hydroxy-2-oxoglutarate aldolase
MAQAAAAGGLRWLEVTWTSDRPAETITRLRESLPDCNIGVGTVLDQTALATAVAAGAEFAFSPIGDPDLIAWAQDQQIPLVAGALTPSEIVAAWQAGAAAVKLFPIHAVGGAAYLRALAPALPAIPLVPTGGVVAAQVPELLAAGAWAVGLAAGVFPRSAIEAGNWPAITAAAQDLCHLIDRDRPWNRDGRPRRVRL